MVIHRRQLYILASLLFLAVLVLLWTPFWGLQEIAASSILTSSSESRDALIFWKIRVPRTIVAFLAGSALGCCGMVFQSMFRNPLATPFTLGVSSGASLGAAIYVWLGFSFGFLGMSGISLFAFIGAVVAILIVWGLTQLRGSFSTTTMLLAGVAVSFFFSSLILFLQYLSNFAQSFRILRWLMGGFEVLGYDSVFGLFPVVLSGVLILTILRHELDLLNTGDDLAISRGVAVKRVRAILFLVTSLMVGSVVAVCGPIGFVGMMAPHICRLLTGWSHRYLLPATFLFGGAFLTLCDTFARTLIAPVEIPVGIITALLGGPFFIWLLLSSPYTRTFSR
jgi:iron complex transport system permease protein